MFIRVVVGLALVALLFMILFVLPGWALSAVVAVFSVAAVFEFLHPTGFVKRLPIVLCAMAYAAAYPPVCCWLPEQAQYALLFFFVAVLFSIAIADHKNVTAAQVGLAFLAGVSVPALLSGVTRIAQLEYGVYLLLLPFVCAYGNDTFALFAGLAAGRHKIAPSISPKKTVEGFIGGIFGSLLLTVIYYVVLKYRFGVDLGLICAVLVGTLGALAAFLGDLSMSYIKRQAGIKDFSRIFPGHGGVLDRIDSLLFAVPVVELILVLFPAVRL